MTRRLLAIAGLLGALAAGCQRGSALEGACMDDRDCPAGMHCVAAAGACAGFTTPLHPDAGPDAADAGPNAVDAGPDAGAAGLDAGDAATDGAS